MSDGKQCFSFADILRRCIWAYVAAHAAWKMYPRTVTVIPNDVLAAEMRDERFNMMGNYDCSITTKGTI